MVSTEHGVHALPPAHLPATPFTPSCCVRSWMLGRFVMDKNGTVWHRQSGRTRRSKKSPGVLGRLARLKPLHNTYASLFRTLPGVKERLR